METTAAVALGRDPASLEGGFGRLGLNPRESENTVMLVNEARLLLLRDAPKRVVMGKLNEVLLSAKSVDNGLLEAIHTMREGLSDDERKARQRERDRARKREEVAIRKLA